MPYVPATKQDAEEYEFRELAADTLRLRQFLADMGERFPEALEWVYNQLHAAYEERRAEAVAPPAISDLPERMLIEVEVKGLEP